MATTTTITHGDDTFKVVLGETDGDAWCSVRLLPQECLLFGASLEWLDCSGCLEDGDATYEIPREAIEKIKSWAIENGYKWEPF